METPPLAGNFSRMMFDVTQFSTDSLCIELAPVTNQAIDRGTRRLLLLQLPFRAQSRNNGT